MKARLLPCLEPGCCADAGHAGAHEGYDLAAADERRNPALLLTANKRSLGDVFALVTDLDCLEVAGNA